MRKTLSVLAVLGIAAIIGTQTAEAFTWSNLNPANWGKCHKCETKKKDNCPKVNPCPCTTGAAAPCDPCTKKAAPCDPCQKEVTQPTPCDACDRLQQQMAK